MRVKTVTEVLPMNYLSVSQTAEKWGISTRRIQILCGEERIPGAMRIGAFWAIPDDAVKTNRRENQERKVH